MWIFFAVLMFVGQASAPIPRKAPDVQSGLASTGTDNTQPQKAPAAPIVPQKETPTSEKSEHPAKQVTEEHKDESKSARDGFDVVNIIVSVLLVLITGFQAYLLCMTLKFLRVQTRATVKAALAASHGVQAARANADAASEGAKAANANAEAASRNADTAKQQVEMFISKERAHIRIEMVPLDIPQIRLRDTPYFVDFKVILYGPTEAYISESGVHVALFDVRHDKQSFSETDMFMPIFSLPDVMTTANRTVESTGWIFPAAEDGIRDAIYSQKKFLMIHGFIKYRDVFERDRETWFRYLWDNACYLAGKPTGKWNKNGPAEENRHT